MLSLNLPQYNFKTKKEGEKTLIFDSSRNQYVVLTPEEWVRQHIIHFLVTEKGVPLSHIKTEYAFGVNMMQKRCDILIFDKEGKMKLMVECKAPHVKIDQAVFNQIATYNYSLHLPYLFVSNGMAHYYAYVDFSNEKYYFIKDLPNYIDL